MDKEPEAVQVLLVDFSAGKLSRSELMEATGLSFEEVLMEMGKAGLPLPPVRATERITSEQKKLYEEILKNWLHAKSTDKP
jgi:hypothetical protein